VIARPAGSLSRHHNPQPTTAMNTTTETATTREIIQAAYDKEAAIITVGHAIRAWLVANEGKKLTKRNKPDLIAVAQAAWVGTDEVRIWPGILGLECYSHEYKRSDCKQGFCFRLGEGECPIVSVEYFDDHNTWFAVAVNKRQPRRLADLASDKPEQIDTLCADYLRAREALGAAIKILDEDYEVRKQLGHRRYVGLELEHF